MKHWHAFAYTGQQAPPDSAARDDNQAVPPREIAAFLRKPASMRQGVFKEAGPALAWLGSELQDNPPLPTDLPVETILKHEEDCLARKADSYVGYYTPGGFMVRALLICPREGFRCPEPPA
jgi:hypothetical protein